MFFLIMALLFIGYLVAQDSGQFNKTTCDQVKELHKWTWKGENGNMYMVCKNCGMLPNGEIEERNRYDF